MSDMMENKPAVRDIPNFSVAEQTIKWGGKDAKGYTVTFGEPQRTIAFREPDLTDHFDILEMAPSSVTESEAWMGMAIIAKVVTDIDGAPNPTPTNKMHLRGALSRIGRDGLAAVARAMQPAGASADAAEITGVMADAAKN